MTDRPSPIRIVRKTKNPPNEYFGDGFGFENEHALTYDVGKFTRKSQSGMGGISQKSQIADRRQISNTNNLLEMESRNQMLQKIEAERRRLKEIQELKRMEREELERSRRIRQALVEEENKRMVEEERARRAGVSINRITDEVQEEMSVDLSDIRGSFDYGVKPLSPSYRNAEVSKKKIVKDKPSRVESFLERRDDGFGLLETAHTGTSKGQSVNIKDNYIITDTAYDVKRHKIQKTPKDQYKESYHSDDTDYIDEPEIEYEIIRAAPKPKKVVRIIERDSYEESPVLNSSVKETGFLRFFSVGKVSLTLVCAIFFYGTIYFYNAYATLLEIERTRKTNPPAPSPIQQVQAVTLPETQDPVNLSGSVSRSLTGAQASEKSESKRTLTETEKSIIDKVGVFAELPKNETPDLKLVKDKTKLSNDSVYQKAENGDIIITYSENKKILIYRPSTNKLISAGVLK